MFGAKHLWRVNRPTDREIDARVRGKVSQNWAELECSSSFLVHGSMKTENSPYRNWPDWDEHHSPSSTSSLDLCPTKVFVDLIVRYLLLWPVDLFLSSSFFSNLNDLLRRFCSNVSWTRQIRRLIIWFDRWTHPSNIFSLLFSRWVFLSLHLLIKLRLLLFLATHILSLSLGNVSIVVCKAKVCSLISLINMSIFSRKTVMPVKIIERRKVLVLIFVNQWKRRLSAVVFSSLMFEDSQMRFVFGFDLFIVKQSGWTLQTLINGEILIHVSSFLLFPNRDETFLSFISIDECETKYCVTDTSRFGKVSLECPLVSSPA